MTLAVKC